MVYTRNGESITVDGVDYPFTITIPTGETSGTGGETVSINITTPPTTVSLYNVSGVDVTVTNSSLDVIKLA